MKFKVLLDQWKKQAAPPLTAEEYAVRLPTEDAARLKALVDLFPALTLEAVITDLLHLSLDEVEAAMPYERGTKVISRDDQGDPLYEDVGMTPRFVELARKHQRALEGGKKS